MDHAPTVDAALEEALQFLPRPGRKGLPPQVVGELEPEDLLKLAGQPGAGLSPLQRIRQPHHAAARLVAEGRKNVEVAAMTGFTPERVWQFKQDPAFQELVEFYKGQVQGKYLNVHERLATLGVMATEELLERLGDEADSFSNAELLDLATKSLDRAGYGPTSKKEVSVTGGVSFELLERIKSEVSSGGAVRSVDEILEAEFTALPAPEGTT